MRNRFVKNNNYISADVDYFISLGYSRPFAEALSVKGVTKHNYASFLNKDSAVFHSPFEMLNMDSAVEIVKKSIENKSNVLVYGDYDADGLTASAILTLFFREKGLTCDAVVPTRKEGYGLHVEVVDRMFLSKHYGLVVTVDCGISNAEEISEIERKYGATVLVTDHHETPEFLPDCVCINPKLGYPFSNLAGAGVAFKLVEAVDGLQKALEFADLAAVGTIGDMMPLTDENRSIVEHGLDNFTHSGLKKLAEASRCVFPLTSTDVAIRIAPKINAAGRVGEPYVALELLLSDKRASSEKVETLILKNDERKTLVETALSELTATADSKTFCKNRLVFIEKDDLLGGIVGILANSFKNTYNLPAVIMTKENDCFVGSARGIDGVNMHELFDTASDLLVKFGGHYSSVGFTVSEDNLHKLQERLVKSLSKYDADVFERKSVYELELENSVSIDSYYKLTQWFQPILPNEALVFYYRGSVKRATLFGRDNAHLAVMLSNGLELKGFSSYSDYCKALQTGAEAEFLFTLDFDKFSNNVCGTLSDLHLCNSLHFEQLYCENFVKNICVKNSGTTISHADAKRQLKQGSVLAVFDSYEAFLKFSARYDFDDFCIDFFNQQYFSRKSVIISPLACFDYSQYESVIVFSSVKQAKRFYVENAVFVENDFDDALLNGLKLDRNVCTRVYRAILNKNQYETIDSCFEKHLLAQISYSQYHLALKVFEDLSLIKVLDRYTVEVMQEKTDLSASKLYCAFSE